MLKFVICYPVVVLQVVQLTLHAVHDDAPVTEYVLGGQFAHVAVPPAEKVPALHGTQAADNVRPLPGGQVVQAPDGTLHVVQFVQFAGTPGKVKNWYAVK